MSYRNIHNWVTNNFGKAIKCEHCGLDKPKKEKQRTFCWSNKSGEYKRDRKDWQQLCYSCHKKYDIERLGLIPWNKGNIKKKPIGVCKWCGDKFTKKRKEQVLCSVKCTSHHNGNKKKQPKETPHA